MNRLALLYLLLIATSTMVYLQSLKTGKVTDIDGNVYKTIITGKYEWMAENLRTSRYNDGEKILAVTDSIIWKSLTAGAFCWYNNDESNKTKYGALYNWHTVNTGKLCPEGWRVPADEEWKFLEGYVDTETGIGNPNWDKPGGRGKDAGQRLKSTSGWASGGSGTDDIGFSALPGGERCSNGRFFVAGRSAFWWTSTELDSSSAWYRNIIYGVEDINRNTHPKWMGFSVRCIRNQK